MRAKKQPTEDGSDFIELVNKYLQTFAAVDEGRYTIDAEQAQSMDAQAQTTFVIRDEGYEVATNDFIVWGIKVYKVIGTQRLRGLNPFLEIMTADYGPVSQAAFELDPSLSIATSDDVKDKEEVNPFWED
ncbi:MAG: hypothetical protein ABW007_19290 [Chitinophagaceae bacterium]